jgi:purine-nucleoside phosphorylase
MSLHIGAPAGAIGKRVLFPGDPLRARFIAETLLSDVIQYSTTRNMLGFTGFTRDGRCVSVQGSGMGMPSLSIYAHELINEYGVEEIIRVGTCGGLQEDLELNDIVLAQGACSDSNINRRRFKGLDYAPLASWNLLHEANRIAGNYTNATIHVGNVLSADLFYNDVDPKEWEMWAGYGVLAVEMESAELYTVAAKKKISALSILTVSDNLVTKEWMSAEDRQNSLLAMAKIAINL